MANADTNLTNGQAFLAENGERDTVTVLPSGLQYEVLEEGDGNSPTASNTVTVHYEGTLIDGTVFDSSYQRGQTISFPLNGVIAGWTEGLQLMQRGATYKLFLPADLAYGSQGAGGVIGPNEALVFKVQLVDFS
jgi:FKBP-type peptidyl-prolyl cis-trans isomerase FklB